MPSLLQRSRVLSAGCGSKQPMNFSNVARTSVCEFFLAELSKKQTEVCATCAESHAMVLYSSFPWFGVAGVVDRCT
jgi:hypothetical protein